MGDPTAAARECPSNVVEYLRPFPKTDATLSALAKPLGSIGNSSLSKVLDNGLKSAFSLYTGSPLIAISIIVFVFLLYEITLTILCAFGLRSPPLAWKLGLAFCYKAKTQEKHHAVRFSKSLLARKVQLFSTLLVSSTIVYIFAIVCGLVFSIIFYRHIEKTRCHAAQVEMEIERGLIHTLSDDALDWMAPVSANRTFLGLAHIERLLPDLINLSLNSEVYLVEIFSFIEETRPLVRQYATAIHDSRKVIKDGLTQDGFVCISSQLLNQSHVNATANAFDDLLSIYDSINDTLPAQRANFTKEINMSPSSWKDIKASANSVASSINWYLSLPADLLNIHITIAFVIFGIAGATAILWMLNFYKCWSHVKKRTTPDPYTYAYLFGTLWSCFAVSLILSSLYALWLLIFTSYGEGTCNFVKSVPKNPEIMENYALTREFIKEDVRRRLVDRCISVHSTGETNMVNIISPTMMDYTEALGSVTYNIYHKGIDKFRDGNAVLTVNTMSQVVDFTDAIAFNFSNSDLFGNKNKLYLPKHFFSAIAYHTPLTHRLGDGFTFPPDMVRALDERVDLIKKYHSALDVPEVAAQCVQVENVIQTDFFTMESILGIIEYSLAKCLNVTASPRTMCVNLHQKSYCGQLEPNASQVYQITSNSIISLGNDPIWVSNFSDYKADPTLEEVIAPCKEKLNPGKESCQAIYLNTVYNGIDLVSKLQEYNWTCNVNASSASKVVNLLELHNNLRQSYIKRDSAVYDVDKITPLFRGEVTPSLIANSIDRNTSDCAMLARDIGELIERVCGSLVQPNVVLFVVFIFIACLCFIGWHLSYRAYLYFLKAQLMTKRAPAIKDAENPAQWLKLIRKNINDQEAIYDLMEESPVSPLKAQNEMDSTTLHYAAYVGDQKTVELLLNKGAEINTKNARGYTPLSVAVSEGHANLARYLVNKQADPCVRDEFGDTPLHAAARAGDFECVQALCQPAAPPPTYRNNEGEFAIEIAEKQGYDQVRTFLGPLTPRN